MASTKVLLHSDYTVGLICALPLEMAAATAMFDEIHSDLPSRPGDPNFYSLGKVGALNIAVACLPLGVYGTTSAAVVATQMQCTFGEIQFGLLVGIGGGVPGENTDIQLGDVVVSSPTENSGGVIQYDYGKSVENGVIERTGFLNRPPQVLLNAMNVLQANYHKRFSRIPGYFSEMLRKYPGMSSFAFPGRKHDILFSEECKHTGGNSCSDCDPTKQVIRPLRFNDHPCVYYGLIGSGNQVIKDGLTRNRLAREHGILCFEMEAAGLMDNFPCLVIRGICDYADSHKNKLWQPYAAASAAAYAKEILSMLSTQAAVDLPLLGPDFKNDYAVGWICALKSEMAVSKALLDEFHTSVPNDLTGHPYILGRIGTLKVVIMCAELFNDTTHVAVRQMLHTFRSIRLGLVVGLGGGVPSEESDVRLGDIVVGKPTKRFGGLLHWDIDHRSSSLNFHYTKTPVKPIQLFLTATAKLQANYLMGNSQIPTHLSKMLASYPQMSSHAFPGREHDLLFKAEYDHDPVGKRTCGDCSSREQVIRPSRHTNDPMVHYGLIGPSNVLMKSGSGRDQLAKDHGILCVDPFGGGLKIRGICDYADSHKNKLWQPYAAATAAAYAKEIISMIPENVATKVPTINSILGW
ncbi:unnamed protein product [Penicillium discolor]